MCPDRQSAIQVGVLLPSRETARRGGSPRELVRSAADAEAFGYDSVWLGESVVARPRFDPLTLLAAVAMGTERVALGTAVMVTPLTHPIRLAHTVACVDQLSAGRVILGVGAGPSYGPSRKEYASLGVPFENRFGRLREGIALCRQLWGAEPVTFAGEYYQVRNVSLAPRPVRAGGPPIWLGAKAAGGRQLAAAHFDGWLPGPASPEWFGASLAQVRDGAVAAGRDPSAVTAAAYLSVAVCDDRSAGAQAAREAIERYYDQPYAATANLHDTYVGPAEQTAGWLSEYVHSGAEHLVVRFLGEDPGRQLRALAPFLPEIRKDRAGG